MKPASILAILLVFVTSIFYGTAHAYPDNLAKNDASASTSLWPEQELTYVEMGCYAVMGVLLLFIAVQFLYDWLKDRKQRTQDPRKQPVQGRSDSDDVEDSLFTHTSSTTRGGRREGGYDTNDFDAGDD